MRGWLQGIWQWLTGAGEIVSEDLWMLELTSPIAVGSLDELVREMVPQNFRGVDYPRFQAWLERQEDTLKFTPFAIFRDT